MTEQRKKELWHAKLVEEEEMTMYRKGVEDRKAERKRKKLVNDLQTKGEPVLHELMMSIRDREKSEKDAQVEEEREDDDDVSLIINNNGEPSPYPRGQHRANPQIQQDFLPLPSSVSNQEWC